jgi:hypothetical protein
MKQCFTSMCIALVAMFAFTTASAQSPSGQFGLGATVGDLTAAQIQYALDPAMHIGANVGLALQDGTNLLTFAPYFKFLMRGSKEFKPFFIGQFVIVSGGGATSTGLGIGAGAEYFISSDFGLFAQVTVLGVSFDPSVTRFGVLTPRIGAEWFF